MNAKVGDKVKLNREHKKYLFQGQLPKEVEDEVFSRIGTVVELYGKDCVIVDFAFCKILAPHGSYEIIKEGTVCTITLDVLEWQVENRIRDILISHSDNTLEVVQSDAYDQAVHTMVDLLYQGECINIRPRNYDKTTILELLIVKRK